MPNTLPATRGERLVAETVRARTLCTITLPDGSEPDLDICESAGGRLMLVRHDCDGTRRIGPMATRAEAVEIASALLGNGKAELPEALFKLALAVLAQSHDLQRSRDWRAAEQAASLGGGLGG